MFFLYLVLISSLLSKGHTQITTSSDIPTTGIPKNGTSSEISTSILNNEATPIVDASLSKDATTPSSEIQTSNNEATIPSVATKAPSSEISTSVPNNQAIQTTDTSPSKVAEKTTSSDIPTISIPNNESSMLSNDSTLTSDATDIQNNNVSLYAYHGSEITPLDRVAMGVISTLSNFVFPGVLFFKISKCMLPRFTDFAISILRPMVPTVILMPMQVAGSMLEFTLGPIIKFLIGVLTPLTELMRITLTPFFGTTGHTLNYFVGPIFGFIGNYLNRLLYPFKFLAESIDKYWINPIFGPLFDMIEAFLDPLAKLLAKLLNRLSPIIDLVEPLLEPLLSVTSSLAPLLRMLPGAATLLKILTILLGHKKVEVSFLAKLLSTFDPDTFQYESYE